MRLNFVFIYLCKIVFSLFLRLCGWKIEGLFPNVSKFVTIVAPHTSFLDFWHMFGARILLDADYYFVGGNKLPRDVYWLAKRSLFRWPLKRILTRLGALPVDRSKSNNTVHELTEFTSQKNAFIIGIAPDGTRLSSSDRNFKWKTGFYHLALNVGVPVVPCCINYSRRILFVGNPVYLMGNFETDMKNILDFYKTRVH